MTSEAVVALGVLADMANGSQKRFRLGKSKMIWSEARWTGRKARSRVRIGRTAGARHIVKSVDPTTLVRLEDGD